jgi:hypothetical protein
MRQDSLRQDSVVRSPVGQTCRSRAKPCVTRMWDVRGSTRTALPFHAGTVSGRPVVDPVGLRQRLSDKVPTASSTAVKFTCVILRT